MFVPGDPRFDELLGLAEAATGEGLRDNQRWRWRELVGELLGELRDARAVPERRRHLRAAAALEVHIVAPDELRGVATSTVGAGGLSLVVPTPPPIGTVLDLSIAVAQRRAPLFVRAQVVWARAEPQAEVGAAFIDAIQTDRELLEGLAVKATLARAALE